MNPDGLKPAFLLYNIMYQVFFVSLSRTNAILENDKETEMPRSEHRLGKISSKLLSKSCNITNYF